MNLDLILEPETLEAVLGDDDLLVVDVCQPGTYEQLHIPGAVHVDPSELVCGVPPAPGKLPEKKKLESLFSRIGYSPDKHIVVYDDEGGGWAGRFIWTLDIIGHTHYSYLNGGLHAWHKENHPVDNQPVTVTSTSVSLSIDETARADMDQVLASLDDDGVKIWDARSFEEYTGTKSSSARAGHIPGAVNLDWLHTMDRTRNLRLLPLPRLKEMLDDLGIREGDRIITHCQTHHRSGLTYLIAKALGYQVQGYDGSWSEWGNRQDTPVETGSDPE